MKIESQERCELSANFIRWSEHGLVVIYIIAIIRFLAAQLLSGSLDERCYFLSAAFVLLIVSWKYSKLTLTAMLLATPWISGWGRVGGWIIPEQPITMATLLWLGAWWKTRHLSSRTVTIVDFLIHFIAWMVLIGWLRAAFLLVQTSGRGSEFLSGIVWSFYSPYIGLTSGFQWLTGLMGTLLLRRIFDEELRNSVRRMLPLTWGISILSFGLIQQCFDWPTRFAPWVVSAPFDDVHSFGSVAVVFLVFASALVAPSGNRSLLNCLWVLFGAVCLLCSWSRSAWIATIVLILMMTLKYLLATGPAQRWQVLRIFGLSVTTLAITVLFIPRTNIFGFKIRTLVQPHSMIQGNHERMALWAIAIRMAKERPLMGQGLGQFFQRSADFDTGHQIVDKLNFAHNNYLQLAAELGFPAAVALVFIIGFALKDFATEGLGASEAGAVAGYGLTMLFNHPLILPIQLVLFWSLVGMWGACRSRAVLIANARCVFD